MFLAPDIVPRTLQQLEKKNVDDAQLRKQEEAFLNQMKNLSEHLKGTTVLGQEPPTPDNSEDDEMTSDSVDDDDDDDDDVSTASVEEQS